MDEAWVLTSGDEDYLRRAGLGSRVKRYRSCGVGCDLQLFDRSRFSEESVRAIRHRLGMAAEDFVIVYVGRAVAFKGYPEVIRAFWRMAARDAAVRLLIVGAGDAVHRTGLSPRETQRVEGDSRIVRAGWTSDVASLLAAADVFALPSRREGLSVAIMEALACGVPVVTSAARGCGELVRGGIDGVILDDVSAESLDQALTALRNDRALRCRMGADARAGRSRFSRRAYEVEQVSIYRRLTDIQESASARGSSP
jgi:glycosyltransferase involved in cell wall biosynthesis